MRQPIDHDDGFTLIELLIVIAIIGIIAALVIPNLLDAMHKAKQKRSMGDIKIVGTALMSWLTDQSGAAAAAGAATIDVSDMPLQAREDLAAILVPQYLQEIPERDGWLADYEYRLDLEDPEGDLVFSVRSLGRDAIAQGTEYTIGPFDPTDYDQDLVWVDGGFIRWPDRGS
ncbi:MAG: prepilin-type N-terminal cleavage/methylation domain-containing protein [Acidobacteriota bacterium]|jgi:general secretion pathway protein G